MSRHRTTAAVLLVLLAAWALAGRRAPPCPRLDLPDRRGELLHGRLRRPRPSGGHQGNDIMAAKRSPVVAVEAGRVVKYTRSANAGCMLYLYGRSGTTYMYIHLNNDRTLRNDNRGGCRNRIAYAPGLVAEPEGARRPADRLRRATPATRTGSRRTSTSRCTPTAAGRSRPTDYLQRGYKHLYPRPAANATRRLPAPHPGKVASTDLDADPQRIRLRSSGSASQNGSVKPARNVTLSVRRRHRPPQHRPGRSSRSRSPTSAGRPRRRLDERVPGDASLGQGAAGTPHDPRHPAPLETVAVSRRAPRAGRGRPLGVVGVADRPHDRDALAPAATTSATFVSSIPPMANQGTRAWPRRGGRTRARRRAGPPSSAWRRRARRRRSRPRRAELLRRVRREADREAEAADRLDREVVLADVDEVGARRGRRGRGGR